jgi:hypothetical protein
MPQKLRIFANVNLVLYVCFADRCFFVVFFFLPLCGLFFIQMFVTINTPKVQAPFGVSLLHSFYNLSRLESASLMYHHAKYNECLNKKQKLRVFLLDIFVFLCFRLIPVADILMFLLRVTVYNQ